LADFAGGFLAGADKVVKAFHLPKNTHPILSPSASSSPHPATLAALPPNRHPSGASSSRKPKTVAEELEETSSDAGAAPPDFVTYDLEEETMDVDSDMMEEVGVLPGADGGLYRHQEAQRHQHVPKTLQQMAEDAARQQELDANAEKEDEIEEIIMSSPITAAANNGGTRRTRATTIKISLPSKISTPNVPSSTRSTPSLASGTKVNSGSQPRPSRRPPPRKASNAKRKRTRGRNAGSESDSENLGDQEEDENGDEDEEVVVRPSPSKRPRGKTATAVAPVATPPSTRTLRPRATKTAAQVEAERQSEAAFRSAVAR
jgi:xeroderma pigmentosum group C-complementing protein